MTCFFFVCFLDVNGEVERTSKSNFDPVKTLNARAKGGSVCSVSLLLIGRFKGAQLSPFIEERTLKMVLAVLS